MTVGLEYGIAASHPRPDDWSLNRGLVAVIFIVRHTVPRIAFAKCQPASILDAIAVKQMKPDI